MKFTESNITEWGLRFPMQNCHLTAFQTVFYKILRHFLIISEFENSLSELHEVKVNEYMAFKYTSNCCQSALFRTSPSMPHDGPRSHSPADYIPDNPLFQGRRSRKMYQEHWICFYMYVIMTTLHFVVTAFELPILAVCEAELELTRVPTIACLTVYAPYFVVCLG